MKPIIGITVDCRQDPDDLRTRGKLTLNWNYAQGISDAGGVPVLIPPTADMVVLAGIIHGWLIPGGDDIDATQFGEENHPKVSLQDPARFEGEKWLLEAIDTELPVFGICYGCQFLNVARGGTLFQHLPDVVGHESHTGGTLQEYQVEPETKLYNVVGDATISGKSYHHQAVNRVGENLKVVSKAEDGTIEAVEATDRPWMIGVQWHPERTLSDQPSKQLFKEFVLAAKRYAESRSRAE
ncbi:MAG: gamma-glutamyl-gamma-aminobutyrate hydrolase family protein [Fimbriimonas sp.]|nr:gamma-glutamyl-gamma-aminobutyrate hydrolase family protein [Fimbriimonas sp.]